MASLPELCAVAESHGCKVLVHGQRYENIEVIAPDGFRFVDGPHSLVGEVVPGESTRAEVVSDLLARTNRGLVACPDNCDCGGC